jgi:outer membrane protein OmpA-like peptidoglycan-associated protein
MLCLSLWAEKNEFERVSIVGLNNPIAVAISPDGLKMVVVDIPKKGVPVFKVSNRPYIKSPWSVAFELEAINKLITPKTRIDGPCFSFDNNYLYFAANFADTKGGMDIYRCKIDTTSMLAPENIGEPINTLADENFPSITGNNRTMLFTREVKMKKLDNYYTGELWMSNLDGITTNWTMPEKINTEINSGGIACSKIYNDNATVFFSKIVDDKRRWEIYWAKRIGDIHWYKPVNLDTLSTNDHEISPAYCTQENTLYFVRINDDFSVKGMILKYPLEKSFQPDKTIEITGNVTDTKTNKPIDANILATNPVLGRINYFTQADAKSGNWKTILNAQTTNMFHIWKEDYSHRYQLFTNDKTNEAQVLNTTLFPEITLTLNTYDQEEFWPLDGKISVADDKGNSINPQEQAIFKGRQKLILPIGKRYLINVSVKDYQPNHLEVALNNIVLFNELIRDIELVPLKRNLQIEVVDEENNQHIDAIIQFSDKRMVKFTPEKLPNNKGLYEITLREGEQYNVEVRGAKGYAYKSLFVDLDADRGLNHLLVQLKPLKRKVPIRLNNINFESNSADLLEGSHDELNRVIQLIKDNSDIRIEIMAHTDDVGSDKFNLVLADKRAASVVEYLVVNGIDPNRLVATGFGETVPLVPNTSDENKAINRRVEMKILDREEPILIEIDN